MGQDFKDLLWWQNAERRYVSESSLRDPTSQALLAASRRGTAVKITYDGGTTPGRQVAISFPNAFFGFKGMIFYMWKLTATCEANTAPFAWIR